jgi:uncharacterized protein (TIGR02246 family)
MMRVAGPAGLALALALAAVVGCSSHGEEGSLILGETDEAKIRHLLQAYPAAWLANDPDAVLDCFVGDAILIPHHGAEIVRGGDAIREFFWPDDSPPVTVDEFEMLPKEIGGKRDLAYVRGRFRLRLTTESGEERRSYTNVGNYLMLLRREADVWRISRYIWNDPVPEVQPAS